MVLLQFFKSKLSLQLLLQLSVDFSETFQLLLPWPEEDHIIPVTLDYFLPELWLFVSFSHLSTEVLA